MCKKYYCEEVVKDTVEREDYARSIERFLDTEKEKAELNRKNFITPEEYAKSPTFYREKFIDMLGFPLREERKTPKLLEKTLVVTDKNVEIFRMRL